MIHLRIAFYYKVSSYSVVIEPQLPVESVHIISKKELLFDTYTSARIRGRELSR